MLKHPKILVTSAAGNTGLPTCLQLLEKGYPVRAFVRQLDHRSKILKEAGAEIFVGDLYSYTDMVAAMRGIQRAYNCAPSAVNGIHFGAIFAVAAHASKLEHVVTLSQWLAQPDHPSFLTREAWLNEHLMGLMPDISHTVNNVGWFAQNYLMVVAPIAQLGMLPMPLGDGDKKKNAPPANEDIAAVNVAALIDPATHSGKTYRPTGPALLSPNDMAAILSKVCGRKVRYNNISEKLFVKALIANGFPVSMISQLIQYCDEYRRGAFAVHSPTSVVEDLSGRRPQDFETIARQTVNNDPEAIQTFSNKMKAIIGFMKILTTRAPNMSEFERSREFALLSKPQFSRDSDVWRAHHDPQAGYIPDGPFTGHNTAALP